MPKDIEKVREQWRKASAKYRKANRETYLESSRRWRQSEYGQIFRRLWFTSPEYRLWNRIRMQENRSGL